MRSQGCQAWLYRSHPAQDTEPQSHPGARTFLSHGEPPVFVSHVDRNGMADSSTVTLLHDMLAKVEARTVKQENLTSFSACSGKCMIWKCMISLVSTQPEAHQIWPNLEFLPQHFVSPSYIWLLPFLQISLSSLKSSMPLDWTAWKCFVSQWFPANIYLVMLHYHLENNLHDVHQESSVILPFRKKRCLIYYSLFQSLAPSLIKSSLNRCT